MSLIAASEGRGGSGRDWRRGRAADPSGAIRPTEPSTASLSPSLAGPEVSSGDASGIITTTSAPSGSVTPAERTTTPLWTVPRYVTSASRTDESNSATSRSPRMVGVPMAPVNRPDVLRRSTVGRRGLSRKPHQTPIGLERRLAGRDLDGPGVGPVEALGVGDQEGEVGQAVEPAREAVGRAVEGSQGGGVEQGLTRAGGTEPAEDVGRRLRSRQRLERGPGRQAIGQGRGQGERDVGAADDQERQVGRAVGGEVQQEAEGLERGRVVDQVGLVDHQERATAAEGRLSERKPDPSERAGQSALARRGVAARRRG